MALTAQERLERIKNEISTNAVTVALHGVDYQFAPLSLGALDKLNDALGDANIAKYVELALLSISRVMEDVTIDELNMVIDSSNFMTVQDAILEVSGYKKHIESIEAKKETDQETAPKPQTEPEALAETTNP